MKNKKKKKKEKETKNENHPLNFQGHNRALNQWHVGGIPFIQTPTVWLPCPKVFSLFWMPGVPRKKSQQSRTSLWTHIPSPPALLLCSNVLPAPSEAGRAGEERESWKRSLPVPPHHPWPEFMDVKSTLCRDKPPLEQPQPRGLQAAPSASSHSPHIPPWGSVGLHRGRRAAIPPPGLSRL